MKNKQKIFLTLVASTFVSQVKTEDYEECLNKCIENEMKGNRKKYSKSPKEEKVIKKDSLVVFNPNKRRNLMADEDDENLFEEEHIKACEKICKKKLLQNKGLRNALGKTREKIENGIEDRVGDLIDENLGELSKGIVGGITELAKITRKAIELPDNFQNKTRPYGMFLQNFAEGWTMKHQGFERLSGEQLDYVNLSKTPDAVNKEIIGFGEVAVARFANTNAWFTGVSGTSKIEIWSDKTQKKVMTLEIYVENPFAGSYKCCVTQDGKKIENKTCLENGKEKLKTTKGFTVLKHPQKSQGNDVMFCRIAIFKDNRQPLPEIPNITNLTEEMNRQNSAAADADEDEYDEDYQD